MSYPMRFRVRHEDGTTAIFWLCSYSLGSEDKADECDWDHMFAKFKWNMSQSYQSYFDKERILKYEPRIFEIREIEIKGKWIEFRPAEWIPCLKKVNGEIL